MFTKRTVRKAARALDLYRPGWYDEIDLARFTTASNNNCVIGQVFGLGYYMAHSQLRALRMRGAPRFAFTAFSPSGHHRKTVAWSEEILARRHADQTRVPDTFPAEWDRETVQL